MSTVAPPATDHAASGPPLPSGTDASGPGRALLPHFPGLEGLRGVAVLAVLAFHANLTWAQGGFLGVSTFFTLSGFLITSLAMAEHQRTGTLDVRSFLRRRGRRLVPAALVALLLALAYTLFVADAVQRRHFAGDVLACLVSMANWRFIVDGRSYGELFSQPSPVLHFWSLAIEGQFYLVFPFAFAALTRYRKGVRRRVILVLAAGIAVSVAVPFIWNLEPNHAYLGTVTRAAELLIGALVAAIVHERRITSRIARDANVRRLLTVAGTIGLAASVLAWHTATIASDFLRHGGFALYAVGSAAVVLGALVPGGVLARMLGIGPIAWLGSRSYGIYLFHWPIFLFLSRPGHALPPLARFLVGGAIALALAELSLRYVERPVRTGTTYLGLPDRWVAPLVATGVALGAIALSASAPKPLLDFDAAEAALAEQTEAAATIPIPSPQDTTPGATPVPRAAIYGDSTALMTSIGFNKWLQSSGEGVPVGGTARLGCGIGRGGDRRNGNDVERIPDTCNNWPKEWRGTIDANRPDLVLVQSGGWDAADRRLWGDKAWRSVGDPIYDDYFRRELLLAVDTLTADGGRIVWLTVPHVGPGKDGNGVTSRGRGADPTRTDRINAMLRELPAKRPGKVAIVDLGTWLEQSGQDVRYRPDGVHFGADEGLEVTQKFLGPAVVSAYEELVQQHPNP